MGRLVFLLFAKSVEVFVALDVLDEMAASDDDGVGGLGHVEAGGGWTLRCECGEWTPLEKAFPKKQGQEVTVIRQGPEGYYRACPKCLGELDPNRGEWVADYPDRPIHGYRISQLFSPKVDPGEILEEYRTTRFPERFYNLKVGVPWADLERRVDVQTTLGLCRDAEPGRGYHVMGVDTGKRLHTVILRTSEYERWPAHVVHLQACTEFSELDELMRRYDVERCVIDGPPETHATRDFAKRWRDVYLCFFQESQRGQAHWDRRHLTVNVNRIEALDASRAAIREGRLTLPPRSAPVDEFARHVACDAKTLDEDKLTNGDRPPVARRPRPSEAPFIVRHCSCYPFSARRPPATGGVWS